jgi:serine protease Do/serine protease DegQ
VTRVVSTSRLVLAVLLVVFVVAPGRAALPTAVDGQPLPSLAPMLARVVPGVVNVSTVYSRAVRNPIMDDPFFQWFFNSPRFEQRYRGRSVGSGVVVDAARGYVVTNNHVIDRADEIRVTLSDGRSLPAKLVGADPDVDLAVLQVAAEGLTGITFADSSKVQVGDFVVAIGNPFGLGQTVTSGIVSALGRSGLSIEGYEDFIQTDASINPGNSGGALVNLRGELTGINTAIYAPNGGNVGIGFAIPANMVRTIMDQLVRFGEVRRGHVGLEVQELNDELARALGTDRRAGGVVVVDVEPDSAAARAGFVAGDVIVRIGDRAITRAGDYYAQLAVTMVGDALPVVVRRDGRERSLRLELAADSHERVAGERLSSLLTGTQLGNHRGERDQASGVEMLAIDRRSRAWLVGLRPGDVIVAANEQPVTTLANLRAATRDARSLLLRIWRDGQFYFVTL